jgi:hypothetical protein
LIPPENSDVIIIPDPDKNYKIQASRQEKRSQQFPRQLEYK